MSCIAYFYVSRETFEPGPGLEPRISRGLEVRGSNQGVGSNFFLKYKIVTSQGTNYKFVFT